MNLRRIFPIYIIVLIIVFPSFYTFSAGQNNAIFGSLFNDFYCKTIGKWLNSVNCFSLYSGDNNVTPSVETNIQEKDKTQNTNNSSGSKSDIVPIKLPNEKKNVSSPKVPNNSASKPVVEQVGINKTSETIPTSQTPRSAANYISPFSMSEFVTYDFLSRQVSAIGESLGKSISSSIAQVSSSIPSSASVSNWDSFFTTPSTRIIAGANLSWDGNTLNAVATEAQSSTSPTFGYITATSTTATSTFSAGIKTTYINAVGTTASSTFANGIDLSNGCFSINGVCLSTGGGGSGNVSGSGATNSLAYWNGASSLSYNSGLTWINSTGLFGIGTSSPSARLSVAGSAGQTAPLFIVSSSTASFATSTAFIINSNGLVGIGTTSPYSALSVNGSVVGQAFSAYDSNATSTFYGAISQVSTSAKESATVSSTELTTSSGWSFGSDQWSGDYTNGFTHTATTTATNLIRTVAVQRDHFYQVTFTVSNRTNGSVDVALGYSTTTNGWPNQLTGVFYAGHKATQNSGDLTFIPSASFDGKISNISVKEIISTSTPIYSITDSLGKSGIELRSYTMDSQNLYLGTMAGQYNTNGTRNTAIGYLTMSENTTGNINTAFGQGALKKNTTGSYNTAIGVDPLQNNTTGMENVGVGVNALDFSTVGNYNTAVGTQASAYNNTGSWNTSLGRTALYTNTAGNYNVAIGFDTLRFSTASENTAVGTQSMFFNTTGTQNTTLGYAALQFNTTGSYNTAVGYKTALRALSSNLTAVGQYALYYNTDGANTTAIGYRAGYGSSGLTASQNNVFLGSYAGAANKTGSNNTILGYQAGSGGLETGSYNILIGQYADATSTSSRGFLNIGNVLFGTGMYSGSVATALPALGSIGIGTTTPFGRLSVNGAVGDNTPIFVVASSTSGSVTRTAFIVDSNGKVGIGTTSPYSALSVNGSVAAQTFSTYDTNSTSTFVGGLNVNQLFAIDATSTRTNLGLSYATTTDYNYYKINMWGDSLTFGATPLVSLAMPSRHIENFGVGGDGSTQIRTRMVAATDRYDQPVVIWAGRNNHNSVATVEADIDAMVAVLKAPKNFLILGVTNGSTETCGSSDLTNITAINTYLSTTYPNNYIDIRAYLLTQGDGSGTDNTDITNCVIPTSLRSDTQHLNYKGYSLVAGQIKNYFDGIDTARYTDKIVSYKDFNNSLNILPAQKGIDIVDGNYLSYAGYPMLIASTTLDDIFLGGGGNVRQITSGQALMTGSTTIGIGRYVMPSVSSGYENIAIGYQSQHTLTSGYQNVSLGNSSNYYNSTGNQNTAIGYKAMYFNTGSNNTALGYLALNNGSTGNSNTAVGSNAGTGITTGQNYNVAVGASSLGGSGGSNTVAIGYQALLQGTSASNIAIGYSAARQNSNSTANTVVGYQGLYGNKTGGSNAVFGFNAMQNNSSATNTTAFGYQAGTGSGTYNNRGGVYVGYQSGFSASTGSDYNTFFGYQSGYNVTTGSYNIMIGQNIGAIASDSVRTLNIGNVLFGTGMYNGASVSALPVLGNIGIGTTSPLGRLSVNGSAGDTTALFVVASTTSGNATSTAFIIDSNGKVGLATTSPAGTLGINGTMFIGGTATSTIQGNLNVMGTLHAQTSYAGDLVFANNFRFTEAPLDGVPQGLILKNQNDGKLLSVDESGNLTITGDICANGKECFGKSLTSLSNSISSLASSTILGLISAEATTTQSLSQMSGDIFQIKSYITVMDDKINSLYSSTTLAMSLSSSTLQYLISSQAIDIIASTTANSLATSTSFIQSIAQSVMNFIQSTGNWIVGEITGTLAKFTRVESDSIDTNTAKVKNLCVDDVCVDKDQLKALLINAGGKKVDIQPKTQLNNNENTNQNNSILVNTEQSTSTPALVSTSTPESNASTTNSEFVPPVVSTSTPEVNMNPISTSTVADPSGTAVTPNNSDPQTPGAVTDNSQNTQTQSASENSQTSSKQDSTTPTDVNSSGL